MSLPYATPGQLGQLESRISKLEKGGTPSPTPSTGFPSINFGTLPEPEEEGDAHFRELTKDEHDTLVSLDNNPFIAKLKITLSGSPVEITSLIWSVINLGGEGGYLTTIFVGTGGIVIQIIPNQYGEYEFGTIEVSSIS